MSTLNMAEARARFEARFPELQAKAKHYFDDYRPEARDEAVANALFLTWHQFHALAAAGRAEDGLLTSTLWFACRQTRSGRTMRAVKGSKFRELFGRRAGARVLTGLDMDGFIGTRDPVPDAVAFRIDTADWLDSLTEHQRRRALDLSEGHATGALAVRWGVTPPAVSLYRRQLQASYERFMSR